MLFNHKGQVSAYSIFSRQNLLSILEFKLGLKPITYYLLPITYDYDRETV